MSLVVLLMIAADIWKHGLHAPHHPDDTADHIAQLLMFGQIIMFRFAAPGRYPARRTLPTLALQLAPWVTTFVLTVALTWMAHAATRRHQVKHRDATTSRRLCTIPAAASRAVVLRLSSCRPSF
ncbi:hypothetical protein [Dyella japonica]|uniref:Uncharacterized protein n=1 Tax=Dyella japonica TaxID=231455 RepID=A0ABV2JNU1_9GAMM